jgi:hypothetical protein
MIKMTVHVLHWDIVRAHCLKLTLDELFSSLSVYVSLDKVFALFYE